MQPLPDDWVDPPVEEVSGTRLCRDCGLALPVADFGDRRDGRCVGCGEKRRDELKERRETDKAQALIADLIDEASRPRTSAPKLEEFCAEMIHQFGSLAQFVKRWMAYIEKLEAMRPTATLGRQFETIVKLLAMNERQRHVEDVNRMNMEQVERAQMIEVTQMFLRAAEDPRRRSEVMKIMGYEDGLTPTIPAAGSTEESPAEGGAEAVPAEPASAAVP